MAATETVDIDKVIEQLDDLVNARTREQVADLRRQIESELLTLLHPTLKSKNEPAEPTQNVTSS